MSFVILMAEIISSVEIISLFSFIFKLLFSITRESHDVFIWSFYGIKVLLFTAGSFFSELEEEFSI